MNKREKEVFQAQLDSEAKVLKALEKQYKEALRDIEERIKILQSDELTQSKVYQLNYQKALKGQVKSILDKLHGDEFSTIQQYLHDSYQSGFIGTMYSINAQGIPIVVPIDQQSAVKAIITDSQISEDLYTHLGVDIGNLKKTIPAEITRGIASNMPFADIARNIQSQTRAPFGRAKTIVRTEAHRIQQASAADARDAANARGCDVVKQWDSTMDGDTRPTHKRLDGQIRETDKPFEMDGKKAMYPGDFGKPEEDCNCRCVALTRAKWALDEDELKQLKERAKFFGLDKTEDFKDYEKKYLNAAASIQTGGNIIEYLKWSKRREKQADVVYEKIRTSDDIALVAKSSGMTVEEITTIKNHIFFDIHELYEGPGRFTSDYDMAVAWKRLVAGKPEERDILLLKHELLENRLEKEYNISASEAHAMASKKYDWSGALEELFGEEGEPDGLL